MIMKLLSIRVVCILFSAALTCFSQSGVDPGSDTPPLQVRLGYPKDAKLLILNADDLAVSHSEDIASLSALDNKFITSATVMAVHSKKSILRMKTAFIDCAEANFLFVVAICIVLS